MACCSNAYLKYDIIYTLRKLQRCNNYENEMKNENCSSLDTTKKLSQVIIVRWCDWLLILLCLKKDFDEQRPNTEDGLESGLTV